MAEKMNLFQKMSAISDEMQTVAKNLNVQATKTSSYKAVSERDIIDAVKPLEHKYGIYSYPVFREILESNMLETESQYGTKTTFMTRIRTVYRFVDVDDPTQYIETTTFAEGIDSQDKGSGKAMTYADKYALMKAYKISTGDDPDQDGSKDEHYKQAKKPAQTATHELYCEDCGQVIEATGSLSAEQVAARTAKKFGKQLCSDCGRKAAANNANT